MVTANEVKEIAKEVYTLKKTNAIKKILDWCNEAEPKIIEDAKNGRFKSYIEIPKDFIHNNLFCPNEIFDIIKKFFNTYNYTVSFCGNYMVLEW